MCRLDGWKNPSAVDHFLKDEDGISAPPTNIHPNMAADADDQHHHRSLQRLASG